MAFNDLSHLLKLTKALWQFPHSRAAVMVGAGFSLNSERQAGSTSRLPTWAELAKIMFNELNPIDADTDIQEREERFARANYLRLATEYEVLHGTAELDKFIRAQIPDELHAPSLVHQKLLKLPWADVFTTNYDTLLERTSVDDQSYSVVSCAEQLNRSYRPRIVKLHGCFSANTKLVINEEHYRRYPIDCAPFVNTVRQSLLENVFVLLGFGGEDPNFLAWIGWIRDQLRNHHAPIYLVGNFSYGYAEREVLKNRGVTVIDLGPLFSGKFFPQGATAASVEWFLDNLIAGRPLGHENWPVPDGFYGQ